MFPETKTMQVAIGLIDPKLLPNLLARLNLIPRRLVDGEPVVLNSDGGFIAVPSAANSARFALPEEFDDRWWREWRLFTDGILRFDLALVPWGREATALSLYALAYRDPNALTSATSAGLQVVSNYSFGIDTLPSFNSILVMEGVFGNAFLQDPAGMRSVSCVTVSPEAFEFLTDTSIRSIQGIIPKGSVGSGADDDLWAYSLNDEEALLQMCKVAKRGKVIAIGRNANSDIDLCNLNIIADRGLNVILNQLAQIRTSAKHLFVAPVGPTDLGVSLLTGSDSAGIISKSLNTDGSEFDVIAPL